MKPYTYTTQREIRRAFWGMFPELRRIKIGGDYVTDTRVTFCDWVDLLAKTNQISEKLADRVTL